MTRRAKDGYLATAPGPGVMAGSDGLRLARSIGLSSRNLDDRPAIRPRPAHRGQLATGGWDRQRVQELLLLSRQPGSQYQIRWGYPVGQTAPGADPVLRHLAGARWR